MNIVIGIAVAVCALLLVATICCIMVALNPLTWMHNWGYMPLHRNVYICEVFERIVPLCAGLVTKGKIECVSG